MSSHQPPAGRIPGPQVPLQADAPEPQLPEPQSREHQFQAPLSPEPSPPDSGHPRPRVGTIVWGLVVLSLAVLIVITGLGLVALDGTYVLIGLMVGAGAALVIGGLLSARGRDKEPIKGKS